MEKAKADHRDPYLSLLEYRNTPVDNLRSPAQLLMSRRLRSVIPSTHQQLQPKVVNHADVYARRVHQQQHQKRYYDRSSKPLSPLQEGQSIRIQERGCWKPAIVIQPGGTDRSYHVRTGDGQEYRRNRRHLLDPKETHNMDNDNDFDPNIATPLTPETPLTSEASEAVPHTVPYQTRYGQEVKPRRVLDL